MGCPCFELLVDINFHSCQVDMRAEVMTARFGEDGKLVIGGIRWNPEPVLSEK
jgi:hypothetical protein